MKQPTKYEVKSRLKKGDEVVVIAGSHKGEKGKIDRVDLKHQRVYVGGVNIVKRHTRPNMMNQQGGIVDKAASVHISNVQLVDPKSKKGTRVGYKIEGDKKSRFAKKSGSILA